MSAHSWLLAGVIYLGVVWAVLYFWHAALSSRSPRDPDGDD